MTKSSPESPAILAESEEATVEEILGRLHPRRQMGERGRGAAHLSSRMQTTVEQSSRPHPHATQKPAADASSYLHADTSSASFLESPSSRSPAGACSTAASNGTFPTIKRVLRLPGPKVRIGQADGSLAFLHLVEFGGVLGAKTIGNPRFRKQLTRRGAALATLKEARLFLWMKAGGRVPEQLQNRWIWEG